jgi:hypothetical protein
MKANRFVGGGCSKYHRRGAFVLRVTVLAAVVKVLIVILLLLLVTVRVLVILIILAIVVVVIFVVLIKQTTLVSLKRLICTFSEQDHIFESCRPMHEDLFTNMRLQAMQKQMFGCFSINRRCSQVDHGGSEKGNISLNRMMLFNIKQLVS